MKARRLGVLLLAGAVIAALAGCGAANASGKTDLVIWDPALLNHVSDKGVVDKDHSFLTQAVAAYEKMNPNVSIKVVETSGDISKSSAQFQAASIAKNGPDIRVSFAGGNTISFSDFLLDLNGVFDKGTMSDLSGWNTVRQGYKPNGKLDALPIGAGSYFYVYYNKKTMADAGVDMSKPPADWSSLLDLAKKVKAAGKTPFFVANQEGYVGAWVIAALAGSELGPDTFTKMYRGAIPIDDPTMVKAYTAYAQLYKDGLTNPDAGSVGNADSLAGFVQGKGAMYFSGGWDNAGLTQSLGDNVGAFPIPVLDGAKYPATLAGGPNVAVSITSYSKNPEAAKDFLRYLAKPSTIDLYVKLSQTEASNSNKADPSVITNPLLKAQAAGLKKIDNRVYPFDNVMAQPVIDQFYKVNATTFLGTTTPKQAVSTIEQAFKKESAQ
ncbi:extracellular solute-binding protein [Diaminobutyricibacter tongyongensis]|uniref:Extracellular solute-binding protein n=1 Tax=Leifsonia tongyongensis TaxID=1268043 RepID=A0A6L9XTY8_9MICO|nr:extracellular solute-binding protein [Diaminobutyricibacter tongyongensis]NEN04745.1 extracellular solute-binding protein [Diaminobutyricibacter tongyongensis]